MRRLATLRLFVENSDSEQGSALRTQAGFVTATGRRLLKEGRNMRQVRRSVIMYMAIPTDTWEVSMNFLQNRRVLWGGAVIIVLIVLLVLYGLPGGETPPAY